jgi:5'-AMP-activated protein kinase, catalytic alpha subunit
MLHTNYVCVTEPARYVERDSAGPLLGRPRGCLRAHNSTARSGAALDAFLGNSPSVATLAALSNLTLASDGDRGSHRTSTDSGRSSIASVGGIGISPSLELSHSPPPNSRDFTRTGVAFKECRDGRVPLRTADGRVVGYRQPASILQRQMQVSDVDLLEPDDPLYLHVRAPLSHVVAVPLTQPSLDEEFAAACSDPCFGFPDASNRVMGYILGHQIGKGGFSIVRKGLHMVTRLPVAIKIIDKYHLKDAKERERVDREVRAMRQLTGHAAIIQLYEAVETQRYIYIVMELCEGGSLLDVVREAHRLDETRAATLLAQLLDALQHCHARGIVHRDVKLENLLLDARGNLRLADFGLCGFFLPGSRLRCHCGSPSYAAPEIVSRQDYVAPPVDVWSAGIVLFAMLAGHLPFYSSNKRALSARIIAAQWNPPRDISSQALDLLTRMLDSEPTTRMTLEQAIHHPWMLGCGTNSATARILDQTTVSTWAKMAGKDEREVLHALCARECSPLTAGYHLLHAAAPHANQKADEPVLQ